jgi:hypothetical protein
MSVDADEQVKIKNLGKCSKVISGGGCVPHGEAGL